MKLILLICSFRWTSKKRSFISLWVGFFWTSNTKQVWLMWKVKCVGSSKRTKKERNFQRFYSPNMAQVLVYSARNTKKSIWVYSNFDTISRKSLKLPILAIQQAILTSVLCHSPRIQSISRVMRILPQLFLKRTLCYSRNSLRKSSSEGIVFAWRISLSSSSWISKVWTTNNWRTS